MALNNFWEIYHVEDLIDKDYLEVGDGYRAKNSEMGQTGLPFLRVSNINNNYFDFTNIDILDAKNLGRVGNKISKTDDIVFTTKGTVGRFAFVKANTPKFVYSPQISYWRVKNKNVLNPIFLMYWLQGPEFSKQVYSVKGLTDMADYVNLRDQRRMIIIAPPLPTQRRIADILSAYDDLIENNTRRIRILEQMAQAIYQEWFGKVDKESLSDGWKLVSVRDVSSYINRGVSPNYDDNSKGVVINQKCIRNDRLNLSLVRNHSTKVSQEKYIRFGDVLVNSTGIGTLGRVAQVYQIVSNCTVDSHVTIVRPNEKVSIDYFGLNLLRLQPVFDSLGVGSTGQTELARETIANADFVLPPKDFQDKFSEIVSPIRRQINLLSAINANLSQTRDLLLPRLVSGEIDVSSLS